MTTTTDQTNTLARKAREYGKDAHKATLTEIWRTKHAPTSASVPLTIRIRIVRDSYEGQSFATAEMLSKDGTWTHLISLHPSQWWDDVRTEKAMTNPAAILLMHVENVFDVKASTS